MYLHRSRPIRGQFVDLTLDRLPCYLVPSSRIRPLATAVAAPPHPALPLASRLMLLMVAPLEYPLSVSSHFVLVFLSFSLHSFSIHWIGIRNMFSSIFITIFIALDQSEARIRGHCLAFHWFNKGYEIWCLVLVYILLTCSTRVFPLSFRLPVPKPAVALSDLFVCRQTFSLKSPNSSCVQWSPALRSTH